MVVWPLHDLYFTSIYLFMNTILANIMFCCLFTFMFIFACIFCVLCLNADLKLIWWYFEQNHFLSMILLTFLRLVNLILNVYLNRFENVWSGKLISKPERFYRVEMNKKNCLFSFCSFMFCIVSYNYTDYVIYTNWSGKILKWAMGDGRGWTEHPTNFIV